MWIKKLYATFGKLDNTTLELSPGLNIVSGSNESGKSTWCAFIRTMFYGISTREKARTGYLPDKEKYRPWNGSPMYGRMELIKGQDEITVERTSARTGVFSKEEAKNVTTGAAVETGAALVGAARGVYERSAFIGQAKIGVDHDAETEKRILSIASSGDESISAGEVIRRLEKKQREIRSVRNLGVLPELESESEALQNALDTANCTEEELSRVEESLAATVKAEKECERALKIAKAEETQKKRIYISEARTELLQKTDEAKAYEKYPSRDTYDEFVLKKDEWRELVLKAERTASDINEARRIAERYSEAAAGFPAFSGMNEELARSTAEADKARLAALKNTKKSPLGITLLVLAVLSAGLGLIHPLIFILTVVFAAAGMISLMQSGKKERELTQGELCARYGTADESAISQALSSYLTALSKKADMQLRLQELEISAEKAKASADMRTGDLKKLLADFGIDDTDIISGEKLLREKVVLRENAYSAVTAARIRVEAIEKSTGTDAEAIEYEESEIPSESAQELEARLRELSLYRKNYELNLAALRERMSGFDRQKAETRLSDISDKIEALSREYDAYAFAIKLLGEADAELKSRFSPEIEKRASEIFRSLCGGNFEVVRIKNSDFEMDVAQGAASEPKSELTLSQGTLDELYFSLRIALCEMILSGEDAPPMVLDDALVNFDNERMQKALKLLKKLSETRQVILFTCHTREAEYFENDKTVNKVTI